MLNVSLSLSRLDTLSQPGRGIERIREVLCLAGNFAMAELYDANRVDWPLIVADHVLGDPQVAASEHAPMEKPSMDAWCQHKAGMLCRPQTRLPDWVYSTTMSSCQISCSASRFPRIAQRGCGRANPDRRRESRSELDGEGLPQTNRGRRGPYGEIMPSRSNSSEA